ncbi:MAG TPA: cytochrome c oxidase subunit 3 [Terriglobales bacterium]|nr:cytochrome c oxidase subunit 3 [Terriglobales bacterium]
MATTVHEPPRGKALPDSPQTGHGSGGLVPESGRMRYVQDDSSAASRTGIWVVIAAITMTFAAFTSAMIVRQGASLDWRHLAMPRILYFNTVVLLASSVTLEIARRRFRSFVIGTESERAGVLRALYATLALGLLFLAGQYMAWLQLKADGLYLATNPSSSFFYVFTAAHGLHLLGGLAGLLYVIRRFGRSALRRGTLGAAAHYWHFMDLLWLYLLLVLWMKL